MDHYRRFWSTSTLTNKTPARPILPSQSISKSKSASTSRSLSTLSFSSSRSSSYSHSSMSSAGVHHSRQAIPLTPTESTSYYNRKASFDTFGECDSGDSVTYAQSVHKVSTQKPDALQGEERLPLEKPHKLSADASSQITLPKQSKDTPPASKDVTLIYASEAVCNKPGSRQIVKALLSKKNKRVYLVLTSHSLLCFKSASKAREAGFDAFSTPVVPTSVDKDAFLLRLVDVIGVHTVISSPFTFRIEFLESDTRQPSAYEISVDNANETTKWLSVLRQAVRAHHANASLISPPETHTAVDRVTKQNDQRSAVSIYKVVFKEKRVKATMENGNPTIREVFMVVLLVIAKFSIYALPTAGGGGAGGAVIDDAYLKSLGRDRHGLLSIQELDYDARDDTFKLSIKQVNKPARQLVFVSTFCETIIQDIRQAIHAIAPFGITYRANIPGPLLDEFSMDGHEQEEDEETQFAKVLQGYCAALNLNRARFQYEIVGPPRAKSFTLLVPHEVKESPPVYSKYELFAILRSILFTNTLRDISLAGHSLQELESWVDDNDVDGWGTTLKISHVKGLPNNALARELYYILTCGNQLKKIDLTDCNIGTGAPSSALSTIGLAMTTAQAALEEIYIGKNKVGSEDLRVIMSGIHTRQGVRALGLQECGLSHRAVDLIISTLLSNHPEHLMYLDVSYPTSVSTKLLEPLFQRCTRLVHLRLGGYDGVPLNLLLEPTATCLPTLQTLDLSGPKKDINGFVDTICRWIQSGPVFQSLYLDNCGLHGRHLSDILASITRSGRRQVHLSVSGNPLVKDIVHLPKILHSFMQGEGPISLSLSKTEWEDGALFELIDCLRDNPTLLRLDLSDIRLIGAQELSQDTVKILTRFFEQNTVLRELNLSRERQNGQDQSGGIGSGVAQALRGLKANTSLERLGISGLDIGDAGVVNLVDALEKNRTLLAIDIDDNGITIEGFKLLISAIERGGNIIELPKPRLDLRRQIVTLKETIAGLIQSENETQWFIIHSTSSSETKWVKTQLQMQKHARKSAEANYQNIIQVIDTLLELVNENFRRYTIKQKETVTLQLQAQSAAQLFSTAQIKLQKVNADKSSKAMPGANLSAVGIPESPRSISSRATSVRSSDTISTGESGNTLHRAYYVNHPPYMTYAEDGMPQPLPSTSLDSATSSIMKIAQPASRVYAPSQLPPPPPGPLPPAPGYPDHYKPGFTVDRRHSQQPNYSTSPSVDSYPPYIKIPTKNPNRFRSVSPPEAVAFASQEPYTACETDAQTLELSEDYGDAINHHYQTQTESYVWSPIRSPFSSGASLGQTSSGDEEQLVIEQFQKGLWISPTNKQI